MIQKSATQHGADLRCIKPCIEDDIVFNAQLSSYITRTFRQLSQFEWMWLVDFRIEILST